jgi:hypothetical protein
MGNTLTPLTAAAVAHTKSPASALQWLRQAQAWCESVPLAHGGPARLTPAGTLDGPKPFVRYEAPPRGKRSEGYWYWSAQGALLATCAPLKAGKFYWEVFNDDIYGPGYSEGVAVAGWVPPDKWDAVGDDAQSWGVTRDPTARHRGHARAILKDRPMGDGSTVMFALDCDERVLYIGAGGVWSLPQ